MSGGRWIVSNFTLKIVLQVAFDVKDFQIVGGPAWINSEGYDISAKADTNAAFEQMRLMIQSLLVDRFKLMVHRATRELPVYDIGVAKSGVKLATPKEGSCSRRDPNEPPSAPRPGERPVCGNIGMRRGAINGVGISMPMLAMVLSGILRRVVTDKTGFTGTFDVHLTFAPDDAIADANVGGRLEGQVPQPADSAMPSIFTALQEQLGLTLISAKGPVEVLVIDHVERPSDN
jgi:uncharacterized protein (TIGR03435 family)